MNGHLERDRFARYAMLLCAALNFVRFQSYRQSVFHGMLQGEALLRAGVRDLRAPKRSSRLDLVWRSAAPVINLVTTSIGPSAPSDKLPRLASALTAAGAGVRIIAIEEAPKAVELAFRQSLEKDFGGARSAQGLIEIADGASGPVSCSAHDVFTAVDRVAAARIEEAFRPSGPAAPVWRPLQEGDLDAGPLLADIHARGGGASAGFAERSSNGLGYRVLKPLAKDFAARTVCMFAHFDPHDRIDPYVVHYLSALKVCGVELIFITASDLDAEAIAPIEPLVAAAVCRQNRGHDFASWALGFELFPQVLDGPHEVIIANDSVYGPVGDLGAMLRRMAGERLDVWSIVESLDIERHGQSWFVAFRERALRSRSFRSFWNDVLPLSDKQAIIEAYEVPIFGALGAEGLQVGVVATSRAAGLRIGNPMMHPWRRMLDVGVPFVKVQLLRDNPVDVYLHGWTAEIAGRGYPVHLILDHLSRTAGRSAAALQTH